MKIQSACFVESRLPVNLNSFINGISRNTRQCARVMQHCATSQLRSVECPGDCDTPDRYATTHAAARPCDPGRAAGAWWHRLPCGSAASRPAQRRRCRISGRADAPTSGMTEVWKARKAQSRRDAEKGAESRDAKKPRSPEMRRMRVTLRPRRETVLRGRRRPGPVHCAGRCSRARGGARPRAQASS